jgi:hypothetical protein
LEKINPQSSLSTNRAIVLKARSTSSPETALRQLFTTTKFRDYKKSLKAIIQVTHTATNCRLMVRRSEQAKITNEDYCWRVEYYEPRNASDNERKCDTQLYGNMNGMFLHAAYQLKTNAYNRIIFSYFKKKHVSEDTRVIGDQIIEWLAYNETDRKQDADSDVIDTSDRYSFSSDTGNEEAAKKSKKELNTSSKQTQKRTAANTTSNCAPLLPPLQNTAAPEAEISTSNTTTPMIIEQTQTQISTPPIPKKDLADMTTLISDSHSPQPQFRIIQTGIQSIPASRIDLTEKKYEK